MRKYQSLAKHQIQSSECLFFKSEFLPELPSDLQEVLEEAVSIQTKIDMKINENNDIATIETRLRNTMEKYGDFINGLQTSKEESKSSFIEQLSGAISALGDSFKEREVVDSNIDEAGGIRIVSLDFKREDINSIILAESNSIPEINEYMEKRKFTKSMKMTTNDNNKKQDRFINKTHCTLAHAQRMRQDNMRKLYDHLIGLSCDVKVNAILFNDDVAALDVTIPTIVTTHESTVLIPPSTNEFTHVTIWCKKGVKAFKSNQLPKLAEKGLAKKIELQSSYSVKGTFSYWYD